MYKTISFKKKLLATAVASAAVTASFSGMTYAQDGSVEEVMVTGIRASMERAMDVKRNTPGVVDAISAEDIGKMPDANLAESMQRIAGVSITRTNGEGARVTVRGIDPSMNMVTLNGRNMPAVTNDGGIGDRASRAFDFASLASESFNGVDVYKTSKANISGGGLGASINLKTVRPLDVSETKASVAVKAVQDSTVYRSDTGRPFTPEVSGIYSWANEDETFGVSITGAYQERDNVRSNAFVNNWQMRTVSANGVHGATPATAVITNPLPAGSLYAIPTDLRYSLEDNHRERTNGLLTFQFRPVENVTATLDHLYTEYDLQADRSQQSTWYNESAISAMTFDQGQEVATPVLYSETYTTAAGKDVSFAQQKYDSNSVTESTALNVVWNVTEAFSLALDYHDSKAKNYTSQTELGLNANVVTGEYSDWRGDLPVMGISFDDSRLDKANNNDVLDGGDVSAAMGSSSWDRQETGIEQLKLDGSLDIGELAFFSESKLQFGVDDRTDSNQAIVNNGTSPRITMGNWGGVDPDTFGPDWSSYFSPRNFGDAFPSFDSTTKDPKFLSYGLDGDINKIIQNLEWVYARGLSNPAIAANFKDFPNGKIQPNGVISLDRTVTEEVTGFYVSFQGGFQIAGLDSSLNIGLRHEETDLTSVAVVTVPVNQSWDGDNDWSLVFDSTEPAQVFRVTNNYDNFLPNIDFDIELNESLKLRASFSETIARPGYGSLSAGTNVSDQYQKQATRGNPLLTPLESQNFDVSVEWYYDDASYVTAALFQKKVSDFIGTTVADETVFGLLDSRTGPRFQAAMAEITARRNANTNNRDGTLWDTTKEAHQHDMMLILAGLDPTVESTSLLGASPDPIQVWDVSLPSNFRDDTINGIELSAQHWFGDSGFGVQANYTMVDSDLEVDNSSQIEQFAMLGVSDTANISAFFDRDGLQARIAYNWRDEYLSSLIQGGNNAPGYVEEYSQIDVSVSYDISENITVSAEGLNITGEDSRLHGRSDNQMFTLEDLGSRYQVGVRYTF
ncbi:MAG TPA: TonB-dependent receptor [Cellvibrio sp.]|nr:TonB-dependent receptor [Cellvibrio sp.]